MGEAAKKIHLSYDDYLALERETDLRHEYLDGEAWAMAGGTPSHAIVKTNLTILVGGQLRGRPCRAIDADLKIAVEDTGLYTYPDLSVICGPLQLSPMDRNAATNPTVLAEVLSPTTEGWDRGGKFAHYRRIPTLQHYLLVSVDQTRVELFTRTADGRWLLSEHGAGTTVPLSAIDLEISVDALYEGLPAEEASPQGAV